MEDDNGVMNIVDKFVSFYDNSYQAAKAIGKTQTMITYWRGNGYIPVKWAKLIESVTEGKINEKMIREAAAYAISTRTY